MHDNDELEKEYNKIDEFPSTSKTEKLIILLEYWNAVVGEKIMEDIYTYRFGQRNEKDERIVQFYTKHS